MTYNSLPPIDELFERFYVDSTSPSGLRWASKGYKCRYNIGDVAGSLAGERYWRVSLGGIKYPTHRIVQVLKTGLDDPSMSVDHIDRDKENNHPFNLRWATMSVQALNRGCRSSTGYKGVQYHTGRCLRKPYQAQAWLDGKMRHLGMFETAQEAHEAWLRAIS